MFFIVLATRQHDLTYLQPDVISLSYEIRESYLQTVKLSSLIAHFLDGTTIASYGNSSIVLWDDAKFLGTKSQQLDCGIVLYDRSVFISKGNVTFSKWRRGAIVGKGDSTLILNGTVVFTDNNNDYIAPDGAPSTYYGGTITLKESSTSVIAGDIDFNNNFAYKGGAIALNDNCHLVLNGTVTFTANHGYYVGGTILVSGGSTLVLDGDITFINNYLDYSVGNGGANCFN